jgi:protein-L-isoaspartate O-methyltransferase
MGTRHSAEEILMSNRYRATLAALVIALAMTSCRRQSVVAETKPMPVVASSAATKAHDPAHPPIECPLAKQGIKADHLRPFEDVEKYIAFLERPDRATWQRPDAVVKALALAGDETVADVGAGSGYFSFRLAQALPRGSVHAIDIDPEMIRHIHHKAMSEGIQNVHVALGKPDDPSVPANVNLVLVCDVLHHVADRAAWLGKLATEMSSGSRLALIEFKEGSLPQGPPEGAKIPKAQIISLVTQAGLTLDKDLPDLLPYQSLLIFRKR